MNVWKISSLVLAGTLAIVVGQGAVRESSACDADEPSAEQFTRLKLARGLAFLDRAEQEVEEASLARPRDRANALAQIAKAKTSIELALAPPPRRIMKRKLLPKPLPSRKVAVEPFTQAAVVPMRATGPVQNPFLRVSVPRRTTRVEILDPWKRASR